MYAWCITIILKCSGFVLKCEYEGPENNSMDVAMKIFSGKTANEVIGLRAYKAAKQVFVRADEIAAYDICVKETD